MIDFFQDGIEQAICHEMPLWQENCDTYADYAYEFRIHGQQKVAVESFLHLLCKHIDKWQKWCMSYYKSKLKVGENTVYINGWCVKCFIECHRNFVVMPTAFNASDTCLEEQQ